MHVTQPTLSRQLKELEEELGKKLFIRKSHHIDLTEEGMILRKRAEEIIDMVVKVEKEFHSMEETIGGDVNRDYLEMNLLNGSVKIIIN